MTGIFFHDDLFDHLMDIILKKKEGLSGTSTMKPRSGGTRI